MSLHPGHVGALSEEPDYISLLDDEDDPEYVDLVDESDTEGFQLLFGESENWMKHPGFLVLALFQWILQY